MEHRVENIFHEPCVTVFCYVLQVFWYFLGQWRCQRMTCDVWWILGIYIPLYICTILRKEQPRVTMATAASSEWASFPLSSVNMMTVVCICSQYCSYCAAHRSLYGCSCKKSNYYKIVLTLSEAYHWICLYLSMCVLCSYQRVWEKCPSLKSYHRQSLCT